MSDIRKKPAWIVRTWQWVRRPAVTIAAGTLLVVGFVVGIVFWGGFNWAMELSNTETFCISCHEMRENAYAEYRNTIHYTNRTGVRATCPDCHVPKDWVHKTIRKVRATNELFHHLAGTVSTPKKFNEKRLDMATSVWRAMKTTDSRECRNCHNFASMDLSVQETRANEQHERALRAGGTCIDCHRGIAHRLPAGADEAAAELYRSLGYKLPHDDGYYRNGGDSGQTTGN